MIQLLFFWAPTEAIGALRAKERAQEKELKRENTEST